MYLHINTTFLFHFLVEVTERSGVLLNGRVTWETGQITMSLGQECTFRGEKNYFEKYMHV